jgi:CubicO group peptidase (beta-lactamase class C family)
MLTRRFLLAAGPTGLLAAGASAQTQSVQGRSLRELLAGLMQRHRVPGASVALLRDGALSDLIAIGADPRTLFQAASISKVVTGIAVLRLAERGALGLDAPVNTMLRSWQLPGDGAELVTPRLLLGHRAGTTVPGFPGYATGTPLPDLRQVLDGTPPANTPAVRVAWPPGIAFRYSGGGTMVLQRLAMDVTGMGFDRLAGDLVLAPAGMAESGFIQPLPGSQADAAVAHDRQGDPLPGRFHVYPELAAAGLWSTPGDLARLALAIAASWNEARGGPLLSRATAHDMATPLDGGPTGLGVFVRPRVARPPWLYHYGVNAGFRSILVFAADASFGLALMTNGEGGRPLIPAFLAGAFEAAGQDPFQAPE